ncbi:MAG: hypothetical protein E6Q97_19640 [Desulfurellales bacterium]|nr:MAG: hypothetical protein E6Q97_19640 [Desulfurellales bacterium]
MSLATRSKIRRLFGGRFTEKGEFIHVLHIEPPRRYHCSCTPNRFVAGQAINHLSSCPFHRRNIEVFLAEESRAVLVIVAFLVLGLCLLSSWAIGTSIYNL